MKTQNFQKNKNILPTRSENLRKVGNLGEDMARSHLSRAGFLIVESNWTARAAEIDLITQDKSGLFWFFEVKFRRNSATGIAAESFTPKKRHDFFRAVSLYCFKNGLDFDLIKTGLIAIDKTSSGYRITRHSNLWPDGF